MELDKSSFLYWYPKIEGHILTPKSIIVHFTSEHERKILMGDHYLLHQVCEAVIGGLQLRSIEFPVFMKTDTYSAKWYWSDTCFVESRETLERNILNLLAQNQEDDQRPVHALIFREYIHPDTKLCAFNGMPIPKERRYFVRGKDVESYHPYWDEESIEFFVGEPPKNWKKLLRELNTDTDRDRLYLECAARAFAELVCDKEDYFSIDFMKGAADGEWYLIDCAEGDKSYCRDRLTEADE